MIFIDDTRRSTAVCKYSPSENNYLTTIQIQNRLRVAGVVASNDPCRTAIIIQKANPTLPKGPAGSLCSADVRRHWSICYVFSSSHVRVFLLKSSCLYQRSEIRLSRAARTLKHPPRLHLTRLYLCLLMHAYVCPYASAFHLNCVNIMMITVLVATSIKDESLACGCHNNHRQPRTCITSRQDSLCVLYFFLSE